MAPLFQICSIPARGPEGGVRQDKAQGDPRRADLPAEICAWQIRQIS
jgi:hypothetical protein